jgi:hypothetical protein
MCSKGKTQPALRIAGVCAKNAAKKAFGQGLVDPCLMPWAMARVRQNRLQGYAALMSPKTKSPRFSKERQDPESPFRYVRAFKKIFIRRRKAALHLASKGFLFLVMPAKQKPS